MDYVAVTSALGITAEDFVDILTDPSRYGEGNLQTLERKSRDAFQFLSDAHHVLLYLLAVDSLPRETLVKNAYLAYLSNAELDLNVLPALQDACLITIGDEVQLTQRAYASLRH